MKRALFGGTFNPIHWGHLLIAEQAREAFQLDTVYFLPSGIPPHKREPRVPASQRIAMIRQAIRHHPAFAVNDWEVRQKRKVYTCETLDYFRSLWPKDKLFFVIGTDSLAQIDTWKQGRSLLKTCTFLVVERPDNPWSQIPFSLKKYVHQVPALPVPFSSSSIRQRLHRGLSVRYQVPDGVLNYIQRHRLYRGKVA